MSQATLLNYNIYTEPLMLEASTLTNSSYGKLQICVSPPSDNSEVYCDQIHLCIPSNIVSTTNRFDVAVTSVEGDIWENNIGGSTLQPMPDLGNTFGGRILQPMPEWENNIGRSTAKPMTSNQENTIIIFKHSKSADGEPYVMKFPLNFTIEIFDLTKNTGVINNMFISEHSSINGASDFKWSKYDFSLVIKDPKFFVKNFIATIDTNDNATNNTAPDDIKGATGGVQNKEKFRLLWEGNASNYVVTQKLKDSTNKQIYIGQGNYVDITEGLTDTATFILDGTQVDTMRGETIHLFETITVTVSNPDITPASITVAGDTVLTGNTTIGNKLETGQLTVSGVSHLYGAAEIGGADANADLFVHGRIDGIGILPIGSMIMYAKAQYIDKLCDWVNDEGKGRENTPFEGWQICNGNNNTPNITNDFMERYGICYMVKQF
jgi:hypothetical protein